MRLAGLLMGAATVLLSAETNAACNVQWNFPDSCYAKDKHGNDIPGPGRSTQTETPMTATDARVVSPGPDSTLMPAPPAPNIVPLRDLSKSIQTISPPANTSPATTNQPVYERYPPGFSGVTGFTANSTSLATTSKPGGISLTKAAAERMPLNLSIDGAVVIDGRLILSGRPNARGSMDAALLLTAMRATCEGRDPYFSLDPDDIQSWQTATERAGDEFLALIEKDLRWKNKKGATSKTPSILQFRTFSASRQYPDYWKRILAEYPDLRSKLVFGPEWLRQTRFGEILYKGDVLLKELAGGAAALDVENVRASKISGYVSATQHTSAKNLLYAHHGKPNPRVALAGGRIWYDLTESSQVASDPPEAIPNFGSELHTLLKQRGFGKNELSLERNVTLLDRQGGGIDISNIYPKMYVRARNPITLEDGTANFPGVNELSAHANRQPREYAAAYSEYRALVEIFRAYVVAVHAVRQDSQICSQLPRELLPAEKTTTALPLYHPTDLSLTVGWYEYSTKKHRRAERAVGALLQGGVRLGASNIQYQTLDMTVSKPVLSEMRTESVRAILEPAWNSESGRHYVAFWLHDSKQNKHQVASVVRTVASDDFGPPIIGARTTDYAAPSRPKKDLQVAQLEQPKEAGPPARSLSLHQPSDLQFILAILFFVAVWFLFLLRRSPRLAQSTVIAMPDMSSSDSVPYISPATRDRNWLKIRKQEDENAKLAQDAESRTYDVAERDFKNVFAMKSMVDRETMIKKWRNLHGGTRAMAMTRLVEQWRHDNRA